MKRLYEYQCTECEAVTEALREMEDRNNCPPCSQCNHATFKIISSGIRATIRGTCKGNWNSGDWS